MSVQKLKIFKKLKGADAFSKNPIIESLIKQKLQSQMVIIKDNFNTLIQRQDAKEKQPSTERQHMKRRLSTQNLGTLTSQKIKESINFTHQSEREVLDFIINRQKSSPFLQNGQIDALNTARTNYDELSIKIKQSDKLKYESLGMKNSKFDEDYQNNLSQRLKQIVPSDVWPLEQPQVKEIIASKSERIELSPLKVRSTMKLNLSNRPSSHSIEPLKRSKSIILKKVSSISQLQIPEITYDPNKFHKKDYISLQKWFQSTIDQLNKAHHKNIDANKDYQQELTSHLNRIYTIYMSTLKEVIRLTYIQSSQKGLLLQKVIWSFIRLFEDLVQEQHKINYEQFKSSSKQINQQRQLYESRIQLLQKLLKQKQSTIFSFLDTKRNIVMSCLTYKKVNEEMSQQIEQLMQQIKSLHHQNDYLMNNLRKLIYQFQQREMIKIQKKDNYNIYYYLNQKNQIEVVAKVPRQELLQKYFESQMKQTAIHNIELDLTQQVNVTEKLENQLTSFWHKKKTYLEIDRIIEENFVTGISQIGIQAYPNGPYECIDHFTQFPQKDQQTFQDFLKRQLTEERETWSQKQVELKEVTISLKEVYEQARESISILSNQNITLKQTIDQKDHQISYLKRKIDQVDEKTVILNKKIAMLEKQLQNANNQIVKLNEQLKKKNEKYLDQKKKVMFQKENNNILAESSYRLKEKLDQSKKQFENLEEKIKILAPHLQKMMTIAQSSQNPTLMKLSQLVQEHLNQYVQKDVQVFLTH